MHKGVCELRATWANFDLNAVKVKFSSNNKEWLDRHTNQCSHLKLFTLKLLKMFRHVSIIRSSPGSCLFLAIITLLKTFTAWFSYNNLVMWQHVVLCRSSVARSFNVNNLSVCIGWCADQVIHEWCSAAKVVRVIESKKRRWAGCGVCIGGTRNPYGISVTKPESRNHCGDLDN